METSSAPMTPRVPRLAYRANEVAAAVGVDPKTVRRWISTGALPVIRRGKVVLVPADTLAEFLRDGR